MSKITIASIMFPNLPFLTMKNFVLVQLILFGDTVVGVFVFHDLIIHQRASAVFTIESTCNVEGGSPMG